MPDEERVTYRYSSNFVAKKILLIISMVVVGWAAWHIINYEATEVASTTPTTTQPTQQTKQTEQKQEQKESPPQTSTVDEDKSDPKEEDTQPNESESAAKFPFTITELSELGDPVVSGSGEQTIYTYTLENQATIQVMTNSNNLLDGDFAWTHRLGDPPATLEIVDTPTAFCTKGTAGCSAGNGVLEVNIVPTADSTHDYYVRIRDALDHNRDTAEQYYGPIIESLTINEGYGG